MQQGVKRHIQQEYDLFNNEKPEKHLVIDGNSLFKRCFLADKRVSGNGIVWGAVFQFLLQLKFVLHQYDFDYVCAFFDGEQSGYQRYKMYSDYKANRDDKNFDAYNENKSEYEKNMDAFCKRTLAWSRSQRAAGKGMQSHESEKESFDFQRDMLMAILEELFIRTARFDTVEGDDLVAYYVLHKKPQDKVVIMSGDKDITQLISDTVIVYDLNVKTDRFINVHNSINKLGFTHENMAVVKTICGDVSDNIGSITGFGGKDHLTLFKFFPELRTKKMTLGEVIVRASELNEKKPAKFLQNLLDGKANGNYNGDPLKINARLVDLSMPILTDEAKEYMDALMYAPIDPDGRDIKNVKNIAYKYKLNDWLDDDAFGRFFSDFNKTISIEKRRFSLSNC